MFNIQFPFSKQDRHPQRNSQRGYVLVEALLVCVGIGFLAVASITLQDTLTRSQSKVSIHSQLSEMRRMVMENLNNPGVWQVIVNNPDNGIKQCISEAKENCDYTPPKAIGLEVSAASKLVIDPKKPEIGFGMNLEGCSTFANKKVSATSCPFQARLTWQPICSVGGDCKQIEVAVQLKADPRFEELYSFSAESYSFTIKKNLDLKRTEMVPGSRTLVFNADSTAPKAVKVFLIMDNSTSMTDNRITLAKGLSTFVEGMKGYDVRYYVYTTESSYQASWWDIPGKLPDDISPTAALEYREGEFTLPDNSKVPGVFSWTKIPGQKFKRWDGGFQLGTDMGERLGVNLHQEADATDLGGVKSTLINIMNTIENSNAGNESGICTMAHILNDKGPHNPIAPGDSAIFLTMSDENDMGFAQEGGEAQICPGESAVHPDDDNIYRKYCPLDIYGDTCDSMKLGMRTPDKFFKTANFQYKQADRLWDAWTHLCESTIPGKCGTVGTTASCKKSDIPWADPDGWKWNNVCYTEVTKQYQEEYWIFERKDVDNGHFSKTKNYCKQSFSYKGITYANGKDFAKRFGGLTDAQLHASGDCMTAGQTNEPDHHGQWAVLNSGKEPSNAVWDIDSFQGPMTTLRNAIPSRMRELFGADGYGMYMVVHDKQRDTAAGCVMDPNEASYGTSYKQLLLSSDTPGNLLSVCSDNYTASLEGMRTQAQQIARDTYVLDPFDPNMERVYAVQVQRNGVPLVLTKSDYGISGSNVQFKSGFIQGNDQIKVVIVPK